MNKRLIKYGEKVIDKKHRTKSGLYKFKCKECKKDAVKKVYVLKKNRKKYEFCTLRCLKKFKRGKKWQ